MPVIRNALSIPIQLTQKLDAKPEPKPTHPSGLTPRQLEICRELGVTPEAFAAAKRGELFPGARRA